VTVRCLRPGEEGPGDAVVLQPLDAAVVRAALVRHGFAPPAASRLAAHAHGHPGALVEVVEALQRDGGLAATSTGLRLVRPGGALPPATRRVDPPPDPLVPTVAAAALLGPRVDLDAWRATVSDCEAALSWLVERRLAVAEQTSVAWVDPWAMAAARGWADTGLLAAAAARIDDPVAAAETWLAAGRPDEAVAVLTPRVSHPGPLPEVVLALWEEAAALAPAPRQVRVTALVHRYFERLRTGAREEAEEAARLALAEAAGDPDARVMALTALAGTDAHAGRLAQAWDRVEAACAVSAASAEVAAVCWGLRGQLAVRTGQWALAVPSLERAVALRVTDVRRVATLVILARTAVMAGDLAAATSALARAEPLLQPEHRASWHEVVGRVRWATGDRAGAEEAFGEALRLAEEAGVPDQELPLLQLARCALGDRPERARALAQRALRAGVATGRAAEVAASRCVLVVALAKLGAEVDALGVLESLDLAAFVRLVTLGDRTLRWDQLLAGAGPQLSPRGRALLDEVLHRVPPDPRDRPHPRP
jgi:tetratricopeptide (TPR) repeat protein